MSIEELQEGAAIRAKQRSELHQKMRDQLVNKVSEEFAPGHLAEDMGLRQSSEEWAAPFPLGLEPETHRVGPEYAQRLD